MPEAAGTGTPAVPEGTVPEAAGTGTPAVPEGTVRRPLGPAPRQFLRGRCRRRLEPAPRQSLRGRCRRRLGRRYPGSSWGDSAGDFGSWYSGSRGYSCRRRGNGGNTDSYQRLVGSAAAGTPMTVLEEKGGWWRVECEVEIKPETEEGDGMASSVNPESSLQQGDEPDSRPLRVG